MSEEPKQYRRKTRYKLRHKEIEAVMHDDYGYMVRWPGYEGCYVPTEAFEYLFGISKKVNEEPKCRRCGYETFLALCPNCLANVETGESPLRKKTVLSECNSECWTPKQCPDHDVEMPPRGRDAPLETYICCDNYMNRKINPRHDWNEESNREMNEWLNSRREDS